MKRSFVEVGNVGEEGSRDQQRMVISCWYQDSTKLRVGGSDLKANSTGAWWCADHSDRKVIPIQTGEVSDRYAAACCSVERKAILTVTLDIGDHMQLIEENSEPLNFDFE